MFKKTLFVIALFAFAGVAGAADCDIGLYSRYVNGVGGVAGTWKEPAVQGDCRWTSEKGFYADGWVSQSTREPGLRSTFANEIDVTVGLDKKVDEKWSYDVHAAYFDIVNPKLLNGINGNFGNVGGTLRYQATASTKVYGNLEGYHGIGDLGFPGGWRAGLGARTAFGPMVVDGTLFHNQNFFGHGQFIKVMLEPQAPIAKFAGGEVRPTVFVWQPIGTYKYERQVVGAIHITW